MLDREQVLALVRNHLVQQGRPALGRGIRRWRCVYRSSGGDKCAIGVLISDKAFHPSLNSEPLCSSDVLGMLEDSGWSIDIAAGDLDFLLALQWSHDEQKLGPAWLSNVLASLDDVERRFVSSPGSISEIDAVRQSRLDQPDQLNGSDPDCSCDGDEFKQVQPSLQLLDLVHE